MAQGRYSEPFFWHRIKNVGWGGGAIVVVQVDAVEIKPYQTVVTDPGEWFDDVTGALTITEDDYKETFVLRIGDTGNLGSVVVEDALTDVWIWDGFFIGAAGDEPFNSTQVAAGNAAFGYAATHHLIGQQIAYDTVHLNRPFLGDYVTHTHPNGSSTVYANGFTPLSTGYVSWHGPSEDFTGVAIRTSDPNGFPEPPQDFSGTEAWYWRRVTTRPESTAAILRRSALVNIRKDFARTAELQDFAIVMEDPPLAWNIRGFPQGTEFTIADGVATPVGSVAPTFSAAGSVGGSHTGTIRSFNAFGFL